MKIWDLVRAVHSHPDVSGSGRPRLLLQHEILPLEDQRDLLPFNLVMKRSKEVVNPVRQHQSDQQKTMEERQGLSNKQTKSQPKERQQNAFARQPLYQPKVSQINRVQVRKRFSRFRELQSQLNKREEQTNALERPGKYINASTCKRKSGIVHMFFSSDVSQFLRTYRGDRPW